MGPSTRCSASVSRTTSRSSRGTRANADTVRAQIDGATAASLLMAVEVNDFVQPWTAATR